jgi:hypothetical protein
MIGAMQRYSPQTFLPILHASCHRVGQMSTIGGGPLSIGGQGSYNCRTWMFLARKLIYAR